MEEFAAGSSCEFPRLSVDLVRWLGPLQFASLCPAVCGLCGLDGVTDTTQSIPPLDLDKKSLVSSVLLTVKLIDGVAVALECGGSVAGRVEANGTSSHIFYGTSQGYVVFSLCSDYKDFDTVLTILDDDGSGNGFSWRSRGYDQAD